MYNAHVAGDSYVAPEVVVLGSVDVLTLGQLNLPDPDGCNCSRQGGSDDNDLLGC